MLIDIHGLVIETHCRSEELLNQLLRPFKYFIKDSGTAAVEVFIEETEPPYDSFPALNSSFSTPRNIVFKGNGIKIIDYFGKGVVVEENKGRKFTIYGMNLNLLQESFYMLVMSLFGQYCDKSGIFRIHALSFSFGNTAAIVTANAGGGKSTLAFAILDSDTFKLMSDDEALVNNRGHVMPFPLGIGTPNENRVLSIPTGQVYHIDRMEYGRKYFVDAEYWDSRLEKRELKNKIYFIAQRMINGEPYIERISRFDTFVSLLRSAVIGLGLYQGIELIFNSGPSDIFKLMPVLFRRMLWAIKFPLESDSYKIYLSNDMSKNINTLKNFAKKTTDNSIRESE